MNPKLDHLRHGDAIVVLGPPDTGDRISRAFTLAEQGYASHVLISVIANVAERTPAARRACSQPQQRFTVQCFVPDPSTTQGEAREIRRLADQNGWHTVMVITSTYHISRARMIIKRCYHDELAMIEAQRRPSATEWPYQFLYQSAGYAKAFLSTGC
jgi:uncharacterized SAM-binding protein YcdF (DUF218 family)